MNNRWTRITRNMDDTLRSLLLAGMVLGGVATHAASEFLDPEVAFKLTAQARDDKHIELRFDVAQGYHLYREKIAAEVSPDTIAKGELELPRGHVEFDPTFQKDVEVFREGVTAVLPLAKSATESFKLTVTHQGCADKGLCYSPLTQAYKVDADKGALTLTALSEEQAEAWMPGGAATALAQATPAAAAIANATATATEEKAQASSAKAGAGSGGDGGKFASALQSGSLLQVAGVFLLAGLLLSFTPCVLPMIPILSSIIVGQGGGTTRAKGFSLALAYSLGMAMVYTALGMAAGLAGEGLAAALQNAWVLGAFALLLATLSLSMFGVYELQMPNGIQSRLTEFSGKLQGGQHVGVFVMGGASALIVGPCVAAPLAGALVYISQTKNVVLGGTALFSMASGMSVPLLLVGLSAGSLLPRAGGWMERVKHFFGVMLLAVALWMVSPVLPSWGLMLGAAALLLASAVYLGAFEKLPDTVTPGRALTKGLGLLLAVVATLQLAGIASGGRDLLQPLQHLASAKGGTAVAAGGQPELNFRTVANLAALDAAVKASDKPVMLDFYADWCVACKEFEKFTFTDANVREHMAGMTLLRVDVTANNADDKALMRKYKLFGPPALLFFPPAGGEMEHARVIGFQDAEAFSEHLARIKPSADVDAQKRQL